MKKKTVRMVVLMMLCAVGALLIGLNAAHLSNGRSAVLFVIGMGLVSMPLTIMGLLQTVWKRKNK